MKIIFDLDGTLICSKRRLYELFCDLVGNRNISFESYWRLKFSGKTNQDILRLQFDFSKDKIDDFVNKWMRSIESDYYLNMDILIPGVHKFLRNAGISNKLYLCTARQSESQVLKQLTDLNILNFFDHIFVTQQKYSKLELIEKSCLKLTTNDWVIGDTGHDIDTGHKLNIKACAVLSGFMNEESLKSYKPDLILPDITKFKVS